MLADGRIRVIVLGVLLRPTDGSLLVFRGYDPCKQEAFCRPLGGGIEFGEGSWQALQREMLEELGVSVRPIRNLGTLESIFVFDGRPGHEIAVVWQAEFEDIVHYQHEKLVYHEGGTQSEAVWVDPARLQAEGIPLYPCGLTELIQQL